MKKLLLLLLPLLLCQEECAGRSTRPGDHWRLVKKKDFARRVPIAKYQSQHTGLHLTIAQLDTPVVQVHMCVPTEVWSNDGAPHVLEHLIFQRSLDFPYKDFLWHVAPRFNCGHLSAYTTTDHTCYHFKAAGVDGAMRFMQVYLNQMLNPSLTDDDILTEAHHINGNGEDGGVIYSEMKGYNSKPLVNMWLKNNDAIFPGNTSYAKNPGGTVDGLRTLTPERIRAYHNRYYNTESIVIVINGNIDATDVFAALEPVEHRAFERRVVSSPLEQMPFSTDYPQLDKDVNVDMPLSAKKGDPGRLYLAWRLPWRLREQLYDTHALKNYVSKYLHGESLSPLQEAFGFGPNAIATVDSFSVYILSHPYVGVSFTRVETKHMDKVEEKFKNLIENQESGDFDLERMRDIIMRSRERTYANLETSASFSVKRTIQDIIYSRSADNWDVIFDDDFDHLLAKSKEYWIRLIKAVFSGHRVRVKGISSEEYRDKLATDEKARLKEQKEKLGKEGMKAKGDRLKKAISSAVNPPAEFIETFPLADTESIKFLTLTSYNYTSKQQPDSFDLKGIPYRVHVDDIDSKYIRFYIYLNVTSFPKKDWFYVDLLTDIWLVSTPVVDGEFVNYGHFVKQRDEVALKFSLNVISTDLIEFYCKCTQDNYVKAVQLTQDTLFNTVIDDIDVKNSLNKAVKKLHKWKNSETEMIDAMIVDMLYTDDYPGKQAAYLRKYKKSKSILDKWKYGGREDVMATLEEVKQRVVQPKQTFLYLAARLDELKRVQGPNADGVWKNFFKTYDDCEEEHYKTKHNQKMHHDKNEDKPKSSNLITPHCPSSFERVNEHDLTAPVTSVMPFNYLNENSKRKKAIIGNYGFEACFVRHWVPLVMEDYLISADEPALKLAREIFTLALNNVIRLHGTAYAGYFMESPSDGYMQFYLYRAQDVPKSYELFREVLANHTKWISSQNNPWLESTIETTKGKLIYEIVNNEATPESLASESSSSVINGFPDTYYNRNYIERIKRITAKDVERVAQKYLVAFNNFDNAFISISCYPTQVDAVASALEDEYDIKFERIDKIEESSFAEVETFDIP